MTEDNIQDGVGDHVKEDHRTSWGRSFINLMLEHNMIWFN